MALVARLAILLAAAIALAAHAAEPSSAQIVGLLKQGGHVLYFRHASTDMSQDDRAMKSYEDCTGQRNLTERGREEARAIGRAVRAVGVPVGKVLASPFCRTMETARLVSGRAEPTTEARGGPTTSDAERYAPLKALLSTPPGKANLVIVSHGNPFIALAGPPYLAEGEMAVVRPNGKDFQVVARVRPEGWKALQAAASNSGAGTAVQRP
jgi:phosphohistidine phosphatase SixA